MSWDTLLFVALWWVAPAPAQAAAVTYALDYIFSPATGPVAPLGTVTLTELGTAVKFDVQNQAGTGTKLDSLYFNFAQGTINPLSLHSPMTSFYTTPGPHDRGHSQRAESRW
jgi:hypothetical protein